MANIYPSILTFSLLRQTGKFQILAMFAPDDSFPARSVMMDPFSLLNYLSKHVRFRSEALARIASTHYPHSAIVADSLNLPHPNGFFDFAISIAVVHHLSTPERRVKAVHSILQTLKPPRDDREGGKALIYVWALEQKNSRRGWDAGDDQDVMVPWVRKEKGGDDKSEESTKTFHRYYHLYESQELERDIAAAGGHVLDQGYEKDNWWAIASLKPLD